MRNQRRKPLTVVVHRPRVDESPLGDETTNPTSYTVERCQFDPDHLGQTSKSRERSSTREVRVLRTGVLNIPGVHKLIADDTVAFLGSTWQVVGNGQVFLDRTKVRVQQARER